VGVSGATMALRAPKPSTVPAKPSAFAFQPARSGMLQRKCACGGSPGLDDKCDECRQNEMGLQRLAVTPAASNAAPPIVHDVLRDGSGRDFDSQEQEARRLAGDRQVPLPVRVGPSWNFSKIPIFPRDRQSAPPPFGLNAFTEMLRPGVVGAIDEAEPDGPGVAAEMEESGDDASSTADFTPAPAPGVFPPSPPPPTPPAPAPAASICDTQLPTGESTSNNGWGSGTAATIGRWSQKLTPASTNFSGCQVTEADPGGGSDSCWFPGSIFSPFTAVTGGTWPVGSGNSWGDDFVGWFTSAVTYYRSKNRAPCSCSFPQSMRIVRASGNVEYVRNQLGGTIGTTTVSSTRAGQSMSKTWP